MAAPSVLFARMQDRLSHTIDRYVASDGYARFAERSPI